MKRCKKALLITMMILVMGSLMTGCGMNNDQNMDETTQNEMNNTTDDNNTTDNVNEGTTGNGDEADGNPAGDARPNGSGANGAGAGIAKKNRNGAGADGVDGTGSTDEDNDSNPVGDAVDDVADGVGEAVDDMGEGIGDAVDNLGGGSFDQYDDAKKYLLDKIGKDNANANYEVRDEKGDLVSYNSADADARGYQFSVYETDTDEKIGIYYVDKETGKIFRYMGKDSVESY